ncbi:MAG: hypothetical protein M3R21_09110 [Candidatus Dormibacteraeota bacterium]|nr:hypothetical protein [Candidatus Dormibacteraeota bacterium]
MRKIVNRKAVAIDADDPAAARVQDADLQTSEPPVDYTKLGEHVASVVRAAEVAAERIREEAETDAERLREHSQQQATTRLDEANREAGKTLSEADRVRAEAEEAAKVMREGAAAHAEEKRRAAEAEAAKVIAAAKHIETREEQAAEEHLRTLQQHVELTEKRLNQLVGGLREVAVQLEDLAEAESLSMRSDEGQTNKGEETLDESLRASIGT